MSRWQTILAASLILGVFGGGASAQPAGKQYIVKFRNSVQGKAALRGAGAKTVLELGPQNAAAVRIPERALQALRNNPNIEYIEEDAVRYPLAQTVPYGIPMVQADQVVYRETPGDPSTGRKICIIDSGYYLNHEDLSANVNYIGGSSNSGTGNWFEDTCGHGTHVAGTISALNNTVGVLGVVPNGNIKLHIVKVFTGSDCGWAYSSTLVNALNVCVSNGANVVSMSLGGGAPSNTENNAFQSAYDSGVLSIAAAGNAGNTTTSYPAGYASVVSVAAVDSAEAVASFSQQNSDVELAAPGVAVLSTLPWKENDSVTTAGAGTISGTYIDGAARSGGTAGTLIFGGLCDSVGAWSGRVVLCDRGTVSFAVKVGNVLSGGGVAAVIANNAPGGFAGTLNGTSTIPAIGISQEDGTTLKNTSLGASATVVSLRTQPDSGYEAWDGTSMATPHVSGVAALVWSNELDCSNAEIRAALDATAKDKGPAGRDNAFGFGIVQAKAAVDYLTANPCGGGGTCQPKGASCTSDSECCSNRCTGKAGRKTCK